MGGYVAVEFTVRFKHLVKQLVLLSPAGLIGYQPRVLRLLRLPVVGCLFMLFVRGLYTILCLFIRNRAMVGFYTAADSEEHLDPLAHDWRRISKRNLASAMNYARALDLWCNTRPFFKLSRALYGPTGKINPDHDKDSAEQPRLTMSTTTSSTLPSPRQGSTSTGFPGDNRSSDGRPGTALQGGLMFCWGAEDETTPHKDYEEFLKDLFPDAAWAVYPDAYHLVLQEAVPDIFRDMYQFIKGNTIREPYSRDLPVEPQSVEPQPVEPQPVEPQPVGPLPVELPCMVPVTPTPAIGSIVGSSLASATPGLSAALPSSVIGTVGVENRVETGTGGSRGSSSYGGVRVKTTATKQPPATPATVSTESAYTGEGFNPTTTPNCYSADAPSTVKLRIQEFERHTCAPAHVCHRGSVADRRFASRPVFHDRYSHNHGRYQGHYPQSHYPQNQHAQEGERDHFVMELGEEDFSSAVRRLSEKDSVFYPDLHTPRSLPVAPESWGPEPSAPESWTQDSRPRPLPTNTAQFTRSAVELPPAPHRPVTRIRCRQSSRSNDYNLAHFMMRGKIGSNGSRVQNNGSRVPNNG
ncbi:alpha/beta hydrolase family protein [Gregarina niphandrodes]|uniref:Alpha/beta hydrolase family protein n=1 Tax=Gregarina niphandrodes TaxID=110365 RepID=A0A023B3G5_GRENI|nr:alpha/beta hydrolase family protein [Gregarina niphandrodes]EZG55319.1 alpha/beta hydrolase family protein [Gregarina niphandrodes]|eukprot:XP_011131642.1 alpha/beta hydrolase family protein [Gregarina niphandrodes]